MAILETKDDSEVFVKGVNGINGYSKSHVVPAVLSLDPPQSAETVVQSLTPDRVEDAVEYTVSNIPLGTIKAVRIITIGAGASGINMAYQMKKHLKNVTHIVYEKNTGAVAPGLRTGILAANLTSHLITTNSHGSRILTGPIYFLLKTRLEDIWNTASTSTISERTLNLITESQKRLETKHRAFGTSKYSTSDILNLHTFNGDLIHSANWPEDFDFQDKTVAVIGNGSTEIQIVPAIQPFVKHLVHLIWSPTWVTPAVERKVNAKFRMLVNGAEAAKVAKAEATSSLLSFLGPKAEEMADQLIPDFSVGCRRITPGVGYLESFSKPNIRVITNAIIAAINKTGINMALGEHITVDAIICATEFEVSFSLLVPIAGRDGTKLEDVWSTPRIPQAYLFMTTPKFPNYLRPNAPISHGSVFTITEQCSKYII